MPKKTLYVRESDLPLWELAQAELGVSISALFSEFLHERTAGMERVETFVHVVHCTPLLISHPVISIPAISTPGEAWGRNFAVMFAPVGLAERGGAMKPHYVQGGEQLLAFLEKAGLARDAAVQMEADLRRQASVSIRATLPRAVVRPHYTLRFRPVYVYNAGGGKELLKVEVLGTPAAGGSNRWHANFHRLDQLLSVLENTLELPAPQMTALRRALLSGEEAELGGRVSGATCVITEEQLMQLGMVEEKSVYN